MIKVTTPVEWLDVGLDEVLSTASESLPLPISVKSLADHASAKVTRLVKLEESASAMTHGPNRGLIERRPSSGR